MSTPCEALPLEIGEQSLRTEFKRNAAIATENALRLPSDHPGLIAFEQTNTKRRIQKKSCGTSTRDLLAAIPNADECIDRKSLTYFD